MGKKPNTALIFRGQKALSRILIGRISDLFEVQNTWMANLDNVCFGRQAVVIEYGDGRGWGIGLIRPVAVFKVERLQWQLAPPIAEVR